MTQTIVQHAAATESTHGALTWTSRNAELWIAARESEGSTDVLGFVERTLGDFAAVDVTGRSLGRFATLADAQAAFLRSPASTAGFLLHHEAGSAEPAPPRRLAPTRPAAPATPWGHAEARVVSAAAIWRG